MSRSALVSSASPRLRTRRGAVAVLAITLLSLLAPRASMAADPPSRGGFLSETKTQADVSTLAVPAGFAESAVFSGLANPTVVQFASDGRVFVAEKSGIIKVFDNLTDTDPHRLRGPAHERLQQLGPGPAGHGAGAVLPDGSVGVRPLCLRPHPRRPTPAPRWGAAGADTDGCPTPPGINSAGLRGLRAALEAHRQRQRLDRVRAGPHRGLVPAVPEPLDRHARLRERRRALRQRWRWRAASTGSTTGKRAARTTPVATRAATRPHAPGRPDAAGRGGRRPAQPGHPSRQTAAAPGSCYSASVLAAGPVGYWRLGDERHAGDGRRTATRCTARYVGAPTRGVPGALTGDTNTAVDFPAATAAVRCPTTRARPGRRAVQLRAVVRAGREPRQRSTRCCSIAAPVPPTSRSTAPPGGCS